MEALAPAKSNILKNWGGQAYANWQMYLIPDFAFILIQDLSSGN